MKLAADENLNGAIVRGLVRQRPRVDLVRVHDAGVSGASDEDVLAWAATEGRVLVTHDVTTITRFAYERVARGERMPGAFEIAATHALKEAIDGVVMLVDSSLEDEWEGQDRSLPLR